MGVIKRFCRRFKSRAETKRKREIVAGSKVQGFSCLRQQPDRQELKPLLSCTESRTRKFFQNGK